jgi:hypothetical protein
MEKARLPRPQPTPEPDDAMLIELRGLRADVRQLCELIDRFGCAYLNAKFPYGKAPLGWPRG